MRLTGLASGSVYPILYALEDRGILRCRQEEESPQVLGRPRRWLYQLTATGVAEAREQALVRHASLRPFELAKS